MKKLITISASKLIERYIQSQDLIASLESAGVAISSVDSFLCDNFEINLVVSMLDPNFEEEDEFLPDVLIDVIEQVYKTNIQEKPLKVLEIFGEVLEFFVSGLDHGVLSNSSGGETVYTNKEGHVLKQSEIFKKHFLFIN